MLIRNITRQTILASNAVFAKTFLSRARGLLGRKDLAVEEALIIPRCPQIHMLFMRFPLDVIFADKNRKVVGLVRGIRPFFLSPYFFRGYYAVELKAGTIAASRVQVGDLLSFE